ncbi:hypothetical protein OFEAOIEE_LOCUS3712 [Methylorubrum extorquens]
MITRRLLWREFDLPSLRSLPSNRLNRLLARKDSNPQPRWRKPPLRLGMPNDNVVDAYRHVAHEAIIADMGLVAKQSEVAQTTPATVDWLPEGETTIALFCVAYGCERHPNLMPADLPPKLSRNRTARGF